MSKLAMDVAIVGGGVAGSSLAVGLAERGLDVVVIEREAVYRDRVRGEGVHPWGVREADRLGLLPTLEAAGATELMGWTVYIGATPVSRTRWDDDDPDAPGEWSVYHPALQDALFQRAGQAGARTFRPARVVERSAGPPQTLRVQTEDGETLVSARLVVGADGRQAASRRWAGVQTIRDPVHHQVGGCLLDRVTLEADSSHMGFFDGGFGLVFPQRDGRARAYVIALDEIVNDLRGPGGFDPFVERLAGALPEGALGRPGQAGPLAFFPNADIWASRAAGNGVALIGDAAGANDPSVGQGLSISFRDARELRDALLEHADWDEALNVYADRRAVWFGVLREYARWMAVLRVERGAEADARRARYNRARELDPTQGGFAGIVAAGPDGLFADEAARRHLFGVDLSDAAMSGG